MPLNLDVDLLRTFIAIADTGSFSKAGEEVFKSQSAVSMQMKRLEDTIGKPLFAKDGRVNRLTADGDHLLDYSRRIVRLSDEAITTFQEPDCAGVVRLGTPDDYAERLLPEILARFARTHPMVEVDAECVSSVILREKTATGDLDLSLATCKSNMHNGEIIRDEPLLWATSARHCVEEKRPLPVAVSDPSCAWRHSAIDALERADIPFRIAYASANSVATSAAVQSGLAVGAIPELSLRPGMKVLTEAEGFPPLPTFQIELIAKPGELSPAAQALRTQIVSSVSNLQTQLAAA
ncbi:MAG: LysR substrate-binding domain-containing protein [Pseudomonadota bacterium]